MATGATLTVATSRFGPLEVDAERVINFPRGVLGFPQYQDYVLIQPDADSSFYWLQSVDTPDLAFVVTDPLLFVPDYAVPVREETQAELGLAAPEEAQVLVIVNKVQDTLTANLQGPLLLNAVSRKGMQIVVSEKKYQTRHPIMQLGRPAAAKPARQSLARTA